MLLYLYTPALVKYSAIESFTSIQWTRRWHSPGAFEIHVRARYDISVDDLIVKGDEAGIVESVHYERTKKSGDELVLEGRLLAGYAARRIVWATQTITGTPEYVMKTLASKNMGADAIAARQIANLTIEASQGFAGDSLDYQNSDVPLADELETLSKDSGLGWDIKFNKTSFIFRVRQGLDRTTSQSTNPRAIFSDKRDSLLTATYEIDRTQQSNVVRVWNGTYEEVVGTETGYLRREIFLSPADVSKDEDGNANDESTQRSLMQQQGTQALTDEELTFEVTVKPTGNLVYGTNYDLGDICTCRVARWDVSMDARLIEAKEIYEKSGFSLELTFGTGTLTFAQGIRRVING